MRRRGSTLYKIKSQISKIKVYEGEDINNLAAGD